MWFGHLLGMLRPLLKAASAQVLVSPPEPPLALGAHWAGSHLLCPRGKGGLFVVSIYLWHTEGLSERNLSSLNHLARGFASFRAPWVIAGDWNITPAMFEKSGWLTLVKGRIHAVFRSMTSLSWMPGCRSPIFVRPISGSGKTHLTRPRGCT